jgi:hypothetical protein
MPEDYQASDLKADAVRNIAAFYDSERVEIVVITDHTSNDPTGAYTLMVHELVHAYQDARWDLSAFRESHATTLDRTLGVRALVEGEAVLFATLADAELAGYGPDDIRWEDYFREWQSAMLELAAESETPQIDVGTLFPYAFGGQFVFDAWHRDEHDGIGDLFADPPDSVRQVMAGHEAWPNGSSNQDGALDPHAAPIMPAPYEYLSGGHMGVWLLNAMLQRTADGGTWTDDLSTVSADFLTVLRRAPGGDVSVIWRVTSDDIIAEYLRLGSVWSDDGPTRHLITFVDGDLVLIASSNDDAHLVSADVQGWTHPEEAFPADPDDATTDTR